MYLVFNQKIQFVIQCHRIAAIPINSPTNPAQTMGKGFFKNSASLKKSLYRFLLPTSFYVENLKEKSR